MQSMLGAETRLIERFGPERDDYWMGAFLWEADGTDALIVEQGASDVLGKDAQAGRVIQNFDVRDITEATALALMEDMLTGQK